MTLLTEVLCLPFSAKVVSAAPGEGCLDVQNPPINVTSESACDRFMIFLFRLFSFIFAWTHTHTRTHNEDIISIE